MQPALKVSFSQTFHLLSLLLRAWHLDTKLSRRGRGLPLFTEFPSRLILGNRASDKSHSRKLRGLEGALSPKVGFEPKALHTLIDCKKSTKICQTALREGPVKCQYEDV